ncbi:MAG: GNAT family N-acetyltransferase [Saprospiraceae bacterium]
MLTFNFSPFPILHSERLLLRRPDPVADLQTLFEHRIRDEVRRYIDRPKQSLEEVEKMLQDVIKGIEKNENIMWIISEKESSKFVGTIGYWRNQPENHRAEIGYSLEPDFWNKGIGTEAIRAVLKYGFEEMKLHSVMANINPLNAASRRVLEKNGFVQEAHFRENYYYDGRFLDSDIYCILCSDFK